MKEHANTTSRSSLTFVGSGLIIGLVLCATLVFATYSTLVAVFGLPKVQTVHAAVKEQHVQAHLDIVLGGNPAHKDWPTYEPTSLTLPANSLVTITIHNYDLGDTALPTGSPFSKVQGTIGGIATADGISYSNLDIAKVAHTFTVMQMHLSVPIPGDAPQGASYASVTFSFHTGAAGTYTFECFDPCGTGATGWMGPMMMKGYMIGSITVQ